VNQLQELALQCNADSHEWFPATADDLFYHVASMDGEAGEAINAAKKFRRGSANFDEMRNKVLEEVTDTLVYAMNIYALLQGDPQWWFDEVRKKNVARFGKPQMQARGGGELRVPEGGPKFPDELPGPYLPRVSTHARRAVRDNPQA
jgi:hypothetical protein